MHARSFLAAALLGLSALAQSAEPPPAPPLDLLSPFALKEFPCQEWDGDSWVRMIPGDVVWAEQREVRGRISLARVSKRKGVPRFHFSEGRWCSLDRLPTQVEGGTAYFYAEYGQGLNQPADRRIPIPTEVPEVPGAPPSLELRGIRDFCHLEEGRVLFKLGRRAPALRQDVSEGRFVIARIRDGAFEVERVLQEGLPEDLLAYGKAPRGKWPRDGNEALNRIEDALFLVTRGGPVLVLPATGRFLGFTRRGAFRTAVQLFPGLVREGGGKDSLALPVVVGMAPDADGRLVVATRTEGVLKDRALAESLTFFTRQLWQLGPEEDPSTIKAFAARLNDLVRQTGDLAWWRVDLEQGRALPIAAPVGAPSAVESLNALQRFAFVVRQDGSVLMDAPDRFTADERVRLSPLGTAQFPQPRFRKGIFAPGLPGLQTWFQDRTTVWHMDPCPSDRVLVQSPDAPLLVQQVMLPAGEKFDAIAFGQERGVALRLNRTTGQATFYQSFDRTTWEGLGSWDPGQVEGRPRITECHPLADDAYLLFASEQAPFRSRGLASYLAVGRFRHGKLEVERLVDPSLGFGSPLAIQDGQGWHLDPRFQVMRVALFQGRHFVALPQGGVLVEPQLGLLFRFDAKGTFLGRTDPFRAALDGNLATPLHGTSAILGAQPAPDGSLLVAAYGAAESQLRRSLVGPLPAADLTWGSEGGLKLRKKLEEALKIAPTYGWFRLDAGTGQLVPTPTPQGAKERFDTVLDQRLFAFRVNPAGGIQGGTTLYK